MEWLSIVGTLVLDWVLYLLIGGLLGLWIQPLLVDMCTSLHIYWGLTLDEVKGRVASTIGGFSGHFSMPIWWSVHLGELPWLIPSLLWWNTSLRRWLAFIFYGIMMGRLACRSLHTFWGIIPPFWSLFIQLSTLGIFYMFLYPILRGVFLLWSINHIFGWGHPLLEGLLHPF